MSSWTQRSGRHWGARILALALSGTVFLMTALILLLKPLPPPFGLVVAAVAASVAAVGCVFVLPGIGWRAGLWGSAAFLVYFTAVLLAYLLAGRPDWHPALAAVVVAAAACGAAELADRSLERRSGREKRMAQ